jgi:hypothetical protein
MLIKPYQCYQGLMNIISDIPGADQSVITYAIANQGGAVARIRRLIAAADYLEAEQREALLGAITEALS